MYAAALVMAGALVCAHSAVAQEQVQLGKLAQDYLMRLNQESGRSVDEGQVVNPEQFERTAVTDSIETVNKTVEELEQEKKRVIDEVMETVKKDIDDAIISIRKQTQTPAYELQRAIDTERTELFEAVAQTVETLRPTDTEGIPKLQEQVAGFLAQIEEKLEGESDMQLDFEGSKRDARSALTRFAEFFAQKRQVIDSREGDMMFADTDQDGLSDYDETYIYKTDPANARTKGTEKTDGEKVREGINPLSDNADKIAYKDPREDKVAYVSSTYRVDKVQLIKEEGEKLAFEGKALPNSHVTLFIYSTPLVATVRTDDSGDWTYETDQKLENGEHQIYVATVDGSGEIVIRSSPILFTKSAEAATIGIAGSLQSSIGVHTFLKDNFILITLAVLIAVVVLTMMFVGSRRDLKTVVADLHNEVKSR
jgi:hypothetical protein